MDRLVAALPLAAPMIIAVLVVFMECPRFVRWPALLAAAGWAIVTMIRELDSAPRALLLTCTAVLVGICRLAWDLRTRSQRAGRDSVVLVVAVVCAFVSWLMIGAPFRLVGSLIVICVLAFCGLSWTFARYRKSFPGDEKIEHTPQVLIARDMRLLEALYNATSGRVGKLLPVQELIYHVKMPMDQIVVACERLLAARSIEESDGSYALRSEGALLVENSHREQGVVRMSTGDSFTFNAPAAGVFGRENTTSGGTFNAAGIPAELIGNVVREATQLRSHVTPDQQKDIDDALNEVQSASADQAKVSQGASRLAVIAKTAGEIGAPLIRVAGELVRVIAGS